VYFYHERKKKVTASFIVVMNVIMLINIPKICVDSDYYFWMVFVLRYILHCPELSFFSFLLVGGIISGIKWNQFYNFTFFINR